LYERENTVREGGAKFSDLDEVRARLQKFAGGAKTAKRTRALNGEQASSLAKTD